jgi:hypothetical protein
VPNAKTKSKKSFFPQKNPQKHDRPYHNKETRARERTAMRLLPPRNNINETNKNYLKK